MLRFINYQKSYGSVRVLNIEDRLIPSGIFWVQGTNGSGKSTLLKTMAGLLAFEGDIQLEHYGSIKKSPIPYRRHVNFAEAEPLYPLFLTGMEMIKLFTSAKKAPAQQEAFFIESMNMQSYITDAISTYSSGMLKKLSLLLAFLGTPSVILLDEPLITVDADSLSILYEWISRQHREMGTTFLLSSHQLIENALINFNGNILVEHQTIKLL